MATREGAGSAGAANAGDEALARAAARLDVLIDWERRDRAPGERGQAMRVDLGPVRDLLWRLGNPEAAVPVVHVAGSKGKGSVAAWVAAGLAAAGLRVGRYGSPHVERLTERVVVDGVEVAPQVLAEALEAAWAVREASVAAGTAGAASTWFDLLTAAALVAFRAEEVDAVVLECGLGGRLDSTNAAHGAVCVVTSVDLEHTAILGSTRAAIAGEKVAIAEEGSVLVTGVPPAPDDAGVVLDAWCALRGIPVLRPAWAGAGGGWSPPRALVERNRELARLALEALGERARAGAVPGPADLGGVGGALLDGLPDPALPGRLEAFDWDGVPVVLDGAHVPSSLEAVLDDLASRPGYGERPVVVVGLGKDKDAAGFLKILGARADTLLCTSVGQPTATPLEELVENATRWAPVVERAPAPRVALQRARDLAAASPGRWVLVTGSLHLVGALRPALTASARKTQLPPPRC